MAESDDNMPFASSNGDSQLGLGGSWSKEDDDSNHLLSSSSEEMIGVSGGSGNGNNPHGGVISDIDEDAHTEDDDSLFSLPRESNGGRLSTQVMLQEATAAAVVAAESNLDTDSVLSADDVEDEAASNRESLVIPHEPPPDVDDFQRMSNATFHFIQEASIERHLSTDQKASESLQSNIDASVRFEESLSDSKWDAVMVENHSEESSIDKSPLKVGQHNSVRGHFSDFQNRDEPSSDTSFEEIVRRHQHTDVDLINDDLSVDSSPSAGDRSSPSLSLSGLSSKSVKEILLSAEVLDKQDMDRLLELLKPDQRQDFDEDALLLYHIFSDFSNQEVSLESARDILQLERRGNHTSANTENQQSVPLPKDSIVKIVEKSKVLSLLLCRNQQHLLQIPKPFLLAFFRILVRLLANETDQEYNGNSLLSCNWKERQIHNHQEENGSDEKDPTARFRMASSGVASEIRGNNGKGERGFDEGGRDYNSRKDVQIYDMVRLQQCGTTFSSTKADNKNDNVAARRLLRLFDLIKGQKAHRQLLAPVTRLLGLTCSAGISERVLRRMISFASSPITGATTVPPVARLMLVRALQAATDGSSRSIFFQGKASLNHFFSFGGGKGLSRTISGLTSWPFRNDFGMAVWFRAETFVNDKSKHPILLSVRAEDGGGIEISLMSLDEGDSDSSSAAVLVVSIFDSDPDGMEEVEVQRLRVPGCILLPRMWYHVAVRHTRSRMKGVFSLSTRQQVSIMLDGKMMLTEPLSFPKVSDEDFTSENKAAAFLQKAVRRSTSRTGLSLTVALGAAFEGQTGSLYLFHENVSDATLRALYDVSAGTAGTVIKASDRNSGWDSRRGDIVRKSRLLDVNIKRDDAEEIVVSQRRHSTGDIVLDWIPASSGSLAVMDMGENEDQEMFELPNDLSKAAFSSKLFLVWDPSRTGTNTAIELHIGAHVKMGDGGVQAWQVNGSQDVISSIGGVQALIPLFQTLICGDIEGTWQETDTGSNDMTGPFKREGLWSIIPDLLCLVASFVQDHGENAREMLRCGGIDVIEDCILTSRKVAVHSPSPNNSSLFGPLMAFPKLSQLLVKSVLRLKAACSHYIGLETKVFSRLLFNTPLWLGGADQSLSVALDMTMLPVLSTIAKANPDKMRDCVGIRDLVFFIKHFVGGDDANTSNVDAKDPSTNEYSTYWKGPLTVIEARHICDILLGIIFEVLGSGTVPRDLSPFLNLLSYCLDSEWDESSQEMGEKSEILRTGRRLERYTFTVKGCSLLLLLLQMKPVVPNLYESFAHCCGSVEGAAGWILCAVVNSFDDTLRALGVRCIVAYIDRTSKSPDSPLSVGSFPEVETTKATPTPEGSSTNRRIQSILAVGKGLAGMGPGVRAIVVPPSRLTARVTYKLLWHLLKGHRSRIGNRTYASLIHLVVDDFGASFSSLTSKAYLLDKFVVTDTTLLGGYLMSPDVTKPLLGEAVIGAGRSLRDGLGISTAMRLLRYLSSDMKDQLLADLLKLSQDDKKSVSTLSNLPDWQPCLFHLISETLERFNAGRSNDNGVVSINPTNSDLPGSDQETSASSQIIETVLAVEQRLDLCLELYATLLGHCVREGGDKALHAVEDAASLQRVCLNGQDVFFLILSRLISNLGDRGTILLKTGTPTGEEEDLLKKSARLVTDAILSSGTEGLDMKSAVRCWRSLRHLSAVTVSIVTKSGFGVAEHFDYRNLDSSAIDAISGGLNGIRLSDTGVPALTAQEYRICVEATGKTRSDPEARSQEIHRRLSVTLASQVLSLLDAFIFPDSLDSSLPQSQLHGLDLVRNCEPRLAAQGPVIASTIRLSLLLLCHLEPCGMKLLQCLSRLRCLLHWALELIREATALEGYSAAFHNLTAPLDRLILAIVLQCHRTLGRCNALLSEVESSPDKYFKSKESQKKYLKRILRAALELQGVVSMAFRGRNEVLRTALTSSAYEALRESLESPNSTSKNASKEVLMRSFLSSSWVAGFQDVIYRSNYAIPEQIGIGSGIQSSNATPQGVLAVEELFAESGKIMDDFEKALNGCFENYLQAQRKWAETDLVRELEYQGDDTVKRMSHKQRTDMTEAARAVTLRSLGAGSRWRAIQRKVMEPWSGGAHWKLARHTDRLGQRLLVVRNRNFSDHEEASYELMLGKEREKEEKAREARLLQKEQLAEVMRRNTDAFNPHNVTDDAGADEEEATMTDSDTESSVDFAEPSVDGEDIELLPGPRLSNLSVPEDDWDHIEAEDVEDDAWAKAFIWSDLESVVARFESVTIVTLQSLIEGSLLLTTHGLYFKKIGEEVSAMSREPTSNQDPNRNATNTEGNDRRWRLSRLAEVLGRRYMLRAQALELFFSDSHELFINFSGGTKERDRFHAKLRNSCKTPMLRSPKSLHPRTVFKRSRLAELWKRRKITNFQYLMELNKMAGRTFNDLMQYPVFPWVLSDYTSDTIDLNDSRVYRDLTKPVGALNPNRLAQLLERYNEFADFGLPDEQRFLYGTHYSSPGVILYFLMRQEPFTSMHIELQSGRFDCPDRLFFDISETWKSCLTLSSDMKELVPEFYCLPEMFLNTNNFPLGNAQDGRPIANVGLPPWAKGSPYEFVRVHRMALESEYVSQNLNHWIDLVFGFKQRGPEAEAAHNVFHYLTYEGNVDLEKITNEVDRAAAESQIQNFGQTPSQLLVKEAHPSRCSAEECWKPLIHSVSASKRLRCYTPSKQFAAKKNAQGQRSAAAKIQAFSDSVSVVYDDLTVASYKWAPTNKRWKLKPDKLRQLARPELSRSRSVIKRGTAVPPSSSIGVGNWSFGFTIGGNAKEDLRQQTVMPPRLMAAKADALSSAEASGYVVSCGYWDNEVKVHSLGGCRLLCGDNGGHRGPVTCLAMGEDGGLMVSGGVDGTCRIWVVDWPDMAIAVSDGYAQTALGSTNDGEQLLSCCRVLWGHETAVTCIDLSSDLDVIVSGDAGGIVCIHTVRLGEYIRSFRPPPLAKKPSGVRKVSLHQLGKFVVHTEDCGLHTYTVNGVRLCSKDAGEKLNDMAVCSGGEILVTGGERCHVLIRNVSTLEILSMLDLSRHGPIRCISLTPEDLNPIPQVMFIGSDDGMITIVDEDPKYAETDNVETLSF